MSKKSAEYWKERFIALEDEQYRKGEAYYADLQKQLRIAQNSITADIERWYGRLAENNGISLANAKKLLKKDELAEFHWDVQKYVEIGKANEVSQKWMEQLENASAKYHISYLESMKLQVQQHCELLSVQYEQGMSDFLGKSYAENFYRTTFELQKGRGVYTNLAALDTRKIDLVLTTPWAADGKNFSGRIWTDKEKLVRELHTELTQCLIRGEDPQKAANRLAAKMKVKKAQAARLIQTELSAIDAKSALEAYKELGVEEFIVIATLDGKTSEICRQMDGQHFKISDYEIGVTANPFHPNCRTTTAPYSDEDYRENSQRIARGEDGKTYYVPESMTYNEWKEIYVDNKESQDTSDKKTDYLIRSHTPGQNISKERRMINEAIASVPLKVQQALLNTVIDVGKNGASQYDYSHDILYIADGADQEAVIHEIGHLVENKLIDSDKIAELRKEMVSLASLQDIVCKTYYDSGGNPVDIFILTGEQFVSEYQGRIYTDNIFNAYGPDGVFQDELLWEFVSEVFREYIQNPDRLEKEFPKFYELIKEAVE